jgi:hypothetical protein
MNRAQGSQWFRGGRSMVFLILVVAICTCWSSTANAELRRMQTVWQESFENGVDGSWQLEHFTRNDRLEVVEVGPGKSAAFEGTHYLQGKSPMSDTGAGFRAESPTFEQMGVDPREPYLVSFAYMIDSGDEACWTYPLASRHVSLVLYECNPDMGLAVIGVVHDLTQEYRRLGAITTGAWHQIDIVVQPHVSRDVSDLLIRIDGVLLGNLEDWPAIPVRDRLVMQDLPYRPIVAENPPLRYGCFGSGNWDQLAVGVQVPEPPITPRNLRFHLDPTPFNPRTVLSFVLPAAEQVRVDVFDVAGRRVETLFNGRLEAGPQFLPWDGKDLHGADVSSGLYLFRVRVGTEVATLRGTLVR